MTSSPSARQHENSRCRLSLSLSLSRSLSDLDGAIPLLKLIWGARAYHVGNSGGAWGGAELPLTFNSVQSHCTCSFTSSSREVFKRVRKVASFSSALLDHRGRCGNPCAGSESVIEAT